MRFGIINAYNYWIEVIQPNWITFENAPTPRTAFNLANSLWSIIEWIKHDSNHNLQNLTNEEIRKFFTTKCPELSIAHDLCSHGKHYTVSKPRTDNSLKSDLLTGAIFCFNTPFGPISEHTVDFWIVNEDGEEIQLHKVFAEIMNFWNLYFNKHNNQPF